jgi:hypothetical protein
MGCVVAIPERDFGWIIGKELTPISTDVFISIPQRGFWVLSVNSLHNQDTSVQ